MAIAYTRFTPGRHTVLSSLSRAATSRALGYQLFPHIDPTHLLNQEVPRQRRNYEARQPAIRCFSTDPNVYVPSSLLSCLLERTPGLHPTPPGRLPSQTIASRGNSSPNPLILTRG